MLYDYDEAAAAVNRICDSNCYVRPKTDCPFYAVCNMVLSKGADAEKERTEAFEAAVIKRYHELKNGRF